MIFRLSLSRRSHQSQQPNWNHQGPGSLNCIYFLAIARIVVIKWKPACFSRCTKIPIRFQCCLIDPAGNNTKSETGQCKTRIADFRLQTESKTQDGVKCRPSINCSRGLVERFNEGKKDPANTRNRTLTCLLDDISFHKSIPFFSGMSSMTQKHNRNLEPFLNLTLRL